MTGRDILKCAAILFMVVDHIGWHFFPDDTAWRAWGRVCVPIWLFLVGFTATARIDAGLVAGFCFLVLLDLVLGRTWLPLNILGTIILVRLALRPVTRAIADNQNMAFIVFIACAVFTPITMLVTEYGAVALAFALAGYYARHGCKNAPYAPAAWCVGAWALFAWQQPILFPNFSDLHMIIMLAGSAVAMVATWRLAPRGAAVTLPVPSVTGPLVRFCGRHTLALYVGHLAVFRIVAFFIQQG